MNVSLIFCKIRCDFSFFRTSVCISGGFGGLNALAVLFAIKFKIIIIASVIAFSVYYYTKFVAVKKCSGSLYRDGAVYPADAS